ncbi:NAD(P)-dependent oxidoreductase [Kingella kingae]|uniref:NAD(P)-dependent oxidoreductase n=1 Tax=Kingella kingae TaxID=504 RepID=UPI0004244B00|nr:NAD(P)-binding oxidoreductase [Kingella kingae]
MMNVIFGANGASGRELIALLNPETTLAALRVPAEDDFFAARNVATDVADALDAEAVAALTAKHQPQIIVSFVGGKNEQGVRSDAVGNIHIIQAACTHAPNAHLVLITSMGCGEQWEHTSEPVRQFLGEALLAKTEAENRLRESALNWTIVRPCGLNNDESEQYCLTENRLEMPQNYMSRKGLAHAVAHILAEPAAHNHKVYSVCSE